MFRVKTLFLASQSQKIGYYLENQGQEGGIFSKEQHDQKEKIKIKIKKVPGRYREYSASVSLSRIWENREGA